MFSWLHVFYSPFYTPGGGSLVIESEMEEKKERERVVETESDEGGGRSCRRQTQLTPGIIQGSDVL